MSDEAYVIKVRCKKDFSLQDLSGNETNMRVCAGYEGEAMVHPLPNGKNFYTVEIIHDADNWEDGCIAYFDMKHESFEEFMEAI